MNKSLVIKMFAVAASVVALAGCEKVGSEKWCQKMEEKDKGEWTANEVSDYTKFCILKMDPDKADKDDK